VCRYFRYAQRETDIVLEALEERITKRLAEGGIVEPSQIGKNQG
jgi:hypothetical protein